MATSKTPKATSSSHDGDVPGKRGPKPKLVLSEALLEQLRALGGIQATVEECAAVLKVSLRTLQNFFADHPEAKDAHEAGKENGKASLRRAQFQLALNGNATMQIWLGKQMLGQREPIQQIEHGKVGDFDDLDEAQLREFILLEAQEIAGETPLLPAPTVKPARGKERTKH